MLFVKFGDNEAFENFALAVHSLVGMLKSLDERRLKSNPELAHVHKEEIQKLVDAGYVKIIRPEEAGKSAESWADSTSGSGSVTYPLSWLMYLQRTRQPIVNVGSVLAKQDLQKEPWDSSVQQLHIFSDASERVYGAVAFLRTVYQGKVYVSFVQARSRVAPKRQLSIPRLELSAALVGAQLADMLNREHTLPIERVTLWSDLTTVLSWLKSDSCRYKVFVGTRVAEIQTLTNVADWRYVNTKDNPADDHTRGQTLEELANSSTWQNGPSFLQQSPDEWPPDIVMSSSIKDTSGEVKSTFSAVTMTESPPVPEVSKYSNWSKLVADTMQILNGAAKDTQVSFDWIKTEMVLFRKVQCDSFPEELNALQSHKKLPTDSRLAQLDPVYDTENNVIRVGGRLWRAESLSCDAQHPVVLDPHHQISQLIIKDFDERLLHYGA
ncbi:uncharacterized protein [Haliotis asinina]|uniref:uncharacterized protein n=1 Tax=Haliotis asinina TaxID=109174 RepID=UPI003531F5CC